MGGGGRQQGNKRTSMMEKRTIAPKVTADHDQSNSSKKKSGRLTVVAPSNSGISCGHYVRLSEGVVRFGIRVVILEDSLNVRVFVRSFRSDED